MTYTVSSGTLNPTHSLSEAAIFPISFIYECCGHCWFQPYDFHHLLRGVVSVHLQILLVGTCQLCSLWSVIGHSHRKMIGQDPICADLHDMGLGLYGNGWAETMFDEGDQNLAIGLVGSVTIEWLSTQADDQSSLHCVVVSTDAMSDHIGRRDARHTGGCSKTSACTGQFGMEWRRGARVCLL